MRSDAAWCGRTLPTITYAVVNDGTTNSGVGGTFPLRAAFPASDARRATVPVYGASVPAAYRVDESARAFIVTPERARLALERIDVEFLARTIGLFGGSVARARSRVAALTPSVLPVPPPCVYALVLPPREDDPSSSERLRHVQDVVRANDALRAARRQGGGRVELVSPYAWSHLVVRTHDAYELLQFRVNVTHDVRHAAANAPPSVAKPPKPKELSYRTAIDGKTGRVRGNLSGKRTNQCARSVATPDPSLAPDEIGLPRSVANTLTVPVGVTAFNYVELTAWAEAYDADRRDADARVGVELTDASGTRDLLPRDARHRWRRARDGMVPPGATVHRMLVDGDVVVVNRQPTLHKPSMLALRVRVLPCSTIRMNLINTTPLNLDFDGDEINVYVPQSEAARYEARTLLDVAAQVVLPSTSSATLGLVQDELLFTHLLTRQDTLLERDEFMQLLTAPRSSQSQPLRLPEPAVRVRAPDGEVRVRACVRTHVNDARSGASGGLANKWSAPCACRPR